MRKILSALFFISIFLFASCGSARYQVCQLAYDNKMYQTDSCIVWENEDVCVSYDFWGKKGEMFFLITNNSDSIIGIDLAKTFFIVGGISNAYHDSQTVFIPPHASHLFGGFYLLTQPVKDCDLDPYPSSKDSVSISYSLENTPLNFINFVTYYVGKQENYIQNNFYIQKVSNYHEQQILYSEREEVLDECGKVLDVKFTYKHHFPIQNTSNAFYIVYY